ELLRRLGAALLQRLRGELLGGLDLLLDGLHAGARRLAHRVGGRDVTGAEPGPLTDDRRGVRRCDRLRATTTERGAWVVHDRAVVVGAYVLAVGDVLVEVVLGARLDVGPVDGDERV